MLTSPQGIALIKGFERLELLAYWDGGRRGKGTLTIGWGHTGKDVVEGLRIDLAAAEALFAEDIREVDDAIADLVDVDLAQHEYDAIASFIFNLGWPRFAKSTLLIQLNLGKRKEAAEEMLRWHHDGGVDVAGLIRRRNREAEVFLRGF